MADHSEAGRGTKRWVRDRYVCRQLYSHAAAKEE
jgi:hypothetical protein